MQRVVNFDPSMGERRTRKPKHNFGTEQHFWEIQPVCIAPILPGETLQSASIQSRVVTSPLKSRVTGYWLEFCLFYVPFRQMPDSANLLAMFIDPTATLTPTAAASHRYYDGRGYDFVSQCLQVVTQEWFRREGEVWSSFVIRANRPAASIGIDTLMDSLIDNTVLPDGGAVAGNMDDVERARIVTEYRRELRLMGADGGQMDYEAVLSTYGARLRDTKKRDRPELLRYLRDWTYPSNTVEPTTGVATTAGSWAIKDAASKNRKFNEPGFLFGVQIIRPKIFAGNQTGNASVMLDRAQRWLPPYMEASPERSLAEFTTTQGPYGKTAGGFANGYWVDVNDLFNHGDQYIDGAGGAGGTSQAGANATNVIALPTTAEVTRFATLTMANTLLATADTYTVSDGNIQFSIKSGHVGAS